MRSSNRLAIVANFLLILYFPALGISQTAAISLNHSASPARNQMMITRSSAGASTSSGQTITLRMPSGTRPETVKAALNGKDVSAKFNQENCSGNVCLSAELTEADGVREGKNVLYATAKNEDGTASSSRLHFEGAQPKPNSGAIRTSSFSKATTTPLDSSPALPTLSSFLPPAVAFTTLTPGGGSTSANWFQVGTQIQLSTSGCTSIYSVIVLDRQTLQPITSAPESSPQCLNTSGALAVYLQTLLPATGTQSSDLVIVGTTAGNVTDTLISITGPFDTRLIGGREYGCTASCTSAFVADRPQQYMAIGVPGAEPGSAYESYTTPTITGPDANATGTLVEDASGNYNFQPGPNVEFIVQPAATAANAYIQINQAPSGPNVNVVYWPPSISNDAGGFWLLVLDRSGLGTLPGCPQNPESNGVIIIPNCGTFVATTGPQGAPGNITQLGPLLSAVTSSQIAILTTVGTAGWGSPSVMAINPNGGNYGDNGTLEVAQALQAYGIPDSLILETGTPGSTYTMIGSPGLGGPLNGHNILSTSYLSKQGQTGYVHGTFAPDNRGLYEPDHSQQEPGLNATTGVATDTANLQLGLVLAQQPVEWPEFSAPLNGSVTLAGQEDAYRYLSYYLLNNWYFIGQVTQNGLQPGVTPPLAYDMHYFFTGSLNAWIDIHTFDPENASFPSNSNGCGSCTWMGPDGTQLNFTVAEFAAVQAQLHNEIADLTNVLGFFVTGSTNLKDVVAAGNSNTALALLQASSEVQANLEQQAAIPPAAPAKVSPWHIVNMIATDVSPYVSFATDGAISPGDVKIADKAIGIIGDVFKYAGSIGGGLSSGKQSSSADIPRLDYSLDTTVGQLAGLGLQGQFLAGFDATLDAITGDWNKLNALGSSSVTNPLYSPTQAAQNTAIAQITTAEQKSMYMSLMPAAFQDQVWYMTSGISTLPDLGYSKNGDTNSCSSFYPGITSPPSGTSAPGVYVGYPTFGGSNFQEPWQGTSGNYFPFQYSEVNPYQDWYVLSLPFLNAGHSNAAATVMDVALANILFGNSPGDVNLSLDEFVATRGPMDQPVTGGSSKVVNFATNIGTNPGFSPDTNAIGISNGNICSQSELNANPPGIGSPTPPANASITTLQAPSSAVVGDDVLLLAKVTRQDSSPAGGSVQFRDGSTVLQTTALDATGSATYTTNALALGQHALMASFASTDGSLPSDSAAQNMTVYSNSPDLSLALSKTMMTVSYGTPSSAIQLTATSLYGMTGALQFSCSGLPVNMTCNFTPAQANITAGGTATTSFTISSNSAAAASLIGPRWFGLLLLPVSLLLLTRIRNGRRRIQQHLLFLLLLAISIGGVVGCGGGSKPTQSAEETGTKTVLVSVSSDSITRTTPLVVNIQ